MKNFTTGLISMAFCLALMFSAFTATAQTDERPDYMEQIVPQDAQEMVTPTVPDADKNVSKSKKNSLSPTLLIPPAGKKIKTQKGFFGKLLQKLNPLNWFGGKKAQRSIGVTLMIVGVILLLAAIVMAILAAGTVNWGLGWLSAILWTLGGLLLVIGFILWLVEFVANS